MRNAQFLEEENRSKHFPQRSQLAQFARNMSQLPGVSSSPKPLQLSSSYASEAIAGNDGSGDERRLAVATVKRPNSELNSASRKTMPPREQHVLFSDSEEQLVERIESTERNRPGSPVSSVSDASGDSTEPLKGRCGDSGETWNEEASRKSKGVTTGTGWRHRLYVCWVILFFAGSSLGAIFINKTCLTGYHFRYPLTLMLGQMGFAIGLLSIMHVMGYHELPRASGAQLGVLAVPTALFTSNVVVGLSALSLVNIPMFSAFRRLTLLFVMGAEYVFLNKTHSAGIMQAVVVMTIGAFISAVDDVTFSRLGYCLVFVNNVLTAAYLASIKRAMKETQYDPLGLLYYTALMGFPLVASLLMMTGELGHVMVAFRTQPELSSTGFVVSLLLTATGAFAVNFSTSLCTHVTSPLTTSVAGQVKNVLQTVLGFFSWGFIPTRLNTIGLLVALAAQVWFAVLKFRERQGCSDGSGTEVKRM